jgi:TonB family protein
MFNNLIESSSHAQEFKRRGSFLLFTTATYLVLFVIAGVISIYAYDAHLETQNTELELLMFVPVPTPETTLEVVRNTIRPASNSDTLPTHSTRIDLISSTSDPTRIPPQVGTVASDVPPARPDSVLGLTNADPPTPVSSSRGVSGGTGNTPVVDMPDPPPPPAPTPTPVIPKVIKVSVVLNSKALSLPKPIYPPIAKQTHTQGMVTVQVLIDESGKVISAKAVSGHPFLIPEAQKAAMQARFSPTTISDQPVKVSGVITYNFVMQ